MIHVKSAEPLILIDISPTQIAIIVISSVFILLVIIGIAVCCLRGLPGSGKNSLRRDNPFKASHGWVSLCWVMKGECHLYAFYTGY